MRDSSESEAASALDVRGVDRLGNPRVWGSTVGAAGATVFVLANRGELADPWPTVAVIVYAFALIAYAWFVFVTPRSFDVVRPAAARAGLVYLGSVVGMLVLIRLGTVLLDRGGATELRPALIVVAVGLHFLPFASAFNTPMFKVLGLVLVVLGAAGLAIGWIGDDEAADAAAVTSGIVMLAVIATDAARTHGHG
jgi:hypothetical protein